MLRFLLTIIVCIFLGTYIWGWYLHVHEGQMDIQSYTEFYWNQVNEKAREYIDDISQLITTVKKPLPERKEFQL